MCKTASYLVTQSGSVLWKFRVDSHEDLIKAFKSDHPELDDTLRPPNNTFVRVEVTPRNRNYIHPDEWVFQLDENIKPSWWNEEFYRGLVMEEHKIFLKQFNALIQEKVNVARFDSMVHPFKDVKPPKRITKKHIALLREWASLGAFVWDSVWDSVVVSVGISVGASVGASMWAYVGSMFNIWGDSYQFQPAVDLWELGLVPSFDGSSWRLHGGPEGKVLFEIEEKELMK